MVNPSGFRDMSTSVQSEVLVSAEGDANTALGHLVSDTIESAASALCELSD
jgi:hypothetical protein